MAKVSKADNTQGSPAHTDNVTNVPSRKGGLSPRTRKIVTPTVRGNLRKSDIKKAIEELIETRRPAPHEG